MTAALTTFRPAFQRRTRAWRADTIDRFPPTVQAAVLEQVHALDRTDYKAANRRTHALTADLKGAHLSRAFDEQSIRDYAENYARACSRTASLEARQAFAVSQGVEPPAGKAITPLGAAARLDDPLWWRRQLRKLWTRAAENSMRDLGIIRKGRAPYASDEAVRHRAAQKRRMRAYLENSVAVNEQGDQLSLLDIAEKSLSNPALRRGELMVRCRGFEEIAKDLGHVAEFVTLTTPSRFHAYIAAAGRNPAFERAIVRDAQDWLCRKWAQARAKLKRLSILLYGFRVAEPHHDATPHWHILCFIRRADVVSLRAVLRAVGLSDCGDEPGAERHRVKFETIDPNQGSATGYIAKYISKNIDGEGVIASEPDHETGTPILSGIARVDAWASIHGIRQFQQIGGPPVGLWREARRLRDRTDDPDIERARVCADTGNWRAFVACVGGIHAGRSTNLKLETVETGALNRYGECRPAAVVGLRCASAVAITRPHRWRIERKGQARTCDPQRLVKPPSADGGRSGHPGSASYLSVFSDLGPVAITVRPAPGYNEPSGWTNPNETSQAGPQ